MKIYIEKYDFSFMMYRYIVYTWKQENSFLGEMRDFVFHLRLQINREPSK